MSAIAGSMAPLMGAYYLAKFTGGRGTLLGTVLGAGHGEVAVIGDGVVGKHACDVASALGARVTVFGLAPQRTAEFERRPNVRYSLSTPDGIAARLREADLVVGAVLRVGARAPHVVTEAMVATMPQGSVIVDVSIDQGGCVATSRPTSHSAPVFVAHGVTHYCVTNMPGAYPRTATLALTAATLPYVLKLAHGGLAAVAADSGFAKGVNTRSGPHPLRGRGRRAPGSNGSTSPGRPPAEALRRWRRRYRRRRSVSCRSPARSPPAARRDSSTARTPSAGARTPLR